MRGAGGKRLQPSSRRKPASPGVTAAAYRNEAGRRQRHESGGSCGIGGVTLSGWRRFIWRRQLA